MDFIPKKTEKEVISIRVDKKMMLKLDRMAYKIDISRNDLIIQCIQFALDNSVIF